MTRDECERIYGAPRKPRQKTISKRCPVKVGEVIIWRIYGHTTSLENRFPMRIRAISAGPSVLLRCTLVDRKTWLDVPGDYHVSLDQAYKSGSQSPISESWRG